MTGCKVWRSKPAVQLSEVAEERRQQISVAGFCLLVVFMIVCYVRTGPSLQPLFLFRND